jgi:hypothetical protein
MRLADFISEMIISEWQTGIVHLPAVCHHPTI